MENDGCKLNLHTWISTHDGGLTTPGMSPLLPEAWRQRHYRRAVMYGAGVYQAGLWSLHCKWKGQSLTSSPLRPSAVSSRHEVAQEFKRLIDKLDLDTVVLAEIFASVCDKWERFRENPRVIRAELRLELVEAVQRQPLTSGPGGANRWADQIRLVFAAALRHIAASISASTQRQQFKSFELELERLLYRMRIVLRQVLRRYSAQLSRPLYSQPIPPTAPLAPPVS